MTEITTIAKKPIRLPSQDYEFLRKEGLRHIENLAHDVWTDFNTHDPGITILEALCYAITELGYRCDFDMKDLVAGQTANQAFYTAKDILTNNPLTINDYRKVLADIEGVQNAWLLASDFTLTGQNEKMAVNEVALYADFKEDKLIREKNSSPLFLSGLYRVLLDLETDDNYGDLNTGDILLPGPHTDNFADGEIMLSFELPSLENWDPVFSEKAASQSPDHISGIHIYPDGKQWKCQVTLDDLTSLEFAISVTKKPAGKIISEADIIAMIQHSFVQKIFQRYIRKLTKAKDIVQQAVKTLHERRNLCEDFISIKSVKPEEISFCFDIDVLPSADIEKVQAEVFFAIENYLNTPIEFYSLREMMEKELPVDEIFSGPVLKHGFIDTPQLEQTRLRTVIYTSDIINLLMDIEGVLAIRNFLMTKYDEDGKAVPGETGAAWCMHIAELHKPVLSAERSKIILFKSQFPFLARYDEVRDTILLLHAHRAKGKMSGLQEDIPIPAGNKRDTESFWPVQYDLPQTYGVGEYGLPANAGEQRSMQQRQLKAYLMFYEQLLADFFSQLSNAYQLLSVGVITHTYYAQFLGDIKDIDQVYKKDADNKVMLAEVIGNPLSNDSHGNGWQQVYESRALFEDRRGRFLDHLLARFAESFNDYALLMYTINYEERTEEKISFDDLTGAKIQTLVNYPKLSRERGKAFNYYPQLQDFTIDASQFWDTDNVSGLEKRICSLTGIADETRRFLYCIKNIEIVCEEKSIEENGIEIIKCFHHFTVITLNGKMMKNIVPYETKVEAEKVVVRIIESGKKKDNYVYVAAEKNLALTDGQQTLAATEKNSFADEQEALKATDEFVSEFLNECGDPVGLHLIEHILLRPRDADFDLLEVCLHNGECPCEVDPYTARASVVLPYWPGHFDNMTFREYFENKISEEAPAQVMLKVCWLNNGLMREFELVFKEWTEAIAFYAEDKKDTARTDMFREANNRMVKKLAELHSEYTTATLHNCDESKDGSNPVMLNKTVLGTLKNQ